MSYKMASLTEGFFTHRACVGTLPCMNSWMSGETWFLAEDFPTSQALMRCNGLLQLTFHDKCREIPLQSWMIACRLVDWIETQIKNYRAVFIFIEYTLFSLCTRQVMKSSMSFLPQKLCINDINLFSIELSYGSVSLYGR